MGVVTGQPNWSHLSCESFCGKQTNLLRGYNRRFGPKIRPNASLKFGHFSTSTPFSAPSPPVILWASVGSSLKSLELGEDRGHLLHLCPLLMITTFHHLG